MTPNSVAELERNLRAACDAVIPHLMDDQDIDLDDRDSEGFDSDVRTLSGAPITRNPIARARWGSVAAALVLVAGVAALAVATGSRGTDAPTLTSPAADEPSTATAPIQSPLLSCDDSGCHGFDPLPVAVGASDYYMGPESLGEPLTDLSLFDNLTRCAQLDTTGSVCEKIEGIAGVNLVTYLAASGVTPDTTNRTEASFQINIGTTFTDIDPGGYAREWGPTQGGGSVSDVVVRGHAGVLYSNETNPGVVWQERPGVLVWVNVPIESNDQLLDIASGVRIVAGPTTIPDRVNVGGGTWGATSNDGVGIVIGRSGGVECFGYRYVNSCDQTISGRTVVRNLEQGAMIAGSTPPDVSFVSVTLSDGGTEQIPTDQFANYTSRLYQTTFSTARVTSIDWIGADGTSEAEYVPSSSTETVDATVVPIGTVAATIPSDVITGVVVVDASGTPGLVDTFVQYLRSTGVNVIDTIQATTTVDQTLLQPVGPDAGMGVDTSSAQAVNAFLGVGGYDTFTPTLIDGELPNGATVVITIGTDGGPPTFTGRATPTT